MQFNSIEFLIFLPIVFFLYWAFSQYRKIQNILIVLVSYIFYGWWNWKLLGLIAFTSLLSWLSGVLIEQFRHKPHSSNKVKIILWGNIIINLAILGIFKYCNFFISNLVDLLSAFHISTNISTLRLLLPVGISFYTFQALSYTIDVYRKQIEPTKEIISFFAYVSFFPQLVAGPIERATNLLPQFLSKRIFNYEKAVDGMRQMLWGLFMKVVIADNCANIVNTIYDHYEEANWQMLILGALLFTFQIYGDFAGYSNVAIGCSKLFGFELKANFKTPYFSDSIPEFWRRWHISLNTWFRDYVYIPLGGNRLGKIKQIRNTFIVFGLSGLWHGANWTYVFWGLYHGLLATIQGRSARKGLFSIISTFVLANIGWIFFRAETISQAFHYIANILTFQSGINIAKLELSNIAITVVFFFIIVLMSIEYVSQNKAHPLEWLVGQNKLIKWCIYAIIVMALLVFPGKAETFIYFQF